MSEPAAADPQPDLEALLADPNLMPSEREALQRLLSTSMAQDAHQQHQEASREERTCDVRPSNQNALAATPEP